MQTAIHPLKILTEQQNYSSENYTSHMNPSGCLYIKALTGPFKVKSLQLQ